MADSRTLIANVAVAGTWYRTGTAEDDIPAEALAEIRNPNVWDRPATDTAAVEDPDDPDDDEGQDDQDPDPDVPAREDEQEPDLDGPAEPALAPAGRPAQQVARRKGR